MKKLFTSILLFLSTVFMFAENQFYFDFGSVNFGYHDKYQIVTEINAPIIGISNTKNSFFAEFSPLNIEGSFDDMGVNNNFEYTRLYFLNLSLSYGFSFGDIFLFSPQVKLSYLNPSDLKDFSVKPNLQFSLLYNFADFEDISFLMQKVLTITVGLDFNLKDKLSPSFYTNVGINLTSFAGLFKP
jgi:hypothetical protein